MAHEYGGPTVYEIVQNWYRILANNPHNKLASDLCGENCNLDSQGLSVMFPAPDVYMWPPGISIIVTLLCHIADKSQQAGFNLTSNEVSKMRTKIEKVQQPRMKSSRTRTRRKKFRRQFQVWPPRVHPFSSIRPLVTVKGDPFYYIIFVVQFITFCTGY